MEVSIELVEQTGASVLIRYSGKLYRVLAIYITHKKGGIYTIDDSYLTSDNEA